MNMTVGINQEPLNLTCSVRAEEIYVLINGVFADSNNKKQLQEQGIYFSPTMNMNDIQSQQVTFTRFTAALNNTSITCTAVNGIGSDPQDSSITATITVVGKYR